MKYTWIRKEKQEFNPSRCSMIYVEHTYNQEVNTFIKNHYEWIKQEFHNRNFDFIYMPEIIRTLPEYRGALYYLPYLKARKDELFSTLTPETYIHKFLSPDELKDMGPTIVRYAGYDSDNSCEIYVSLKIELDSEETVEDQFRSIFQQMDESSPNSVLRVHNYFKSSSYWPYGFSFGRSSREKKKLSCPADEDFPDEVRKLINEIRERVEELSKYDIRKEILMDLFRPKQELSRMIITPDLRILLPDYDTEIILPPLPKAIYLLFLLHPKGIYFKQLVNKRKELKSIYKAVTNRKKDETIDKVIENVTDPFGNAINEKCSIIYKTFKEKFKHDISEEYVIDGFRGEPKMIKLDRSLVTWQAKIPGVRLPLSMRHNEEEQKSGLKGV